MASTSSRKCCVAYGCSNNPVKDPNLSFHRFPSDTERKDKWANAVRRKGWKPTSSSVLCSAHFTRDQFQVPPGLKQRARLHPTAIPTIFPSHPVYLQPEAKKPRRQLVRNEYTPQRLQSPPESESGSSATQSTSLSDTCTPGSSHSPDETTIPIPCNESTPQKKVIPRGRPKLSPKVRISCLTRRVNTLSQTVGRLRRKNAVMLKTIQMLKKENKLNSCNLELMDSAIGELIKNEQKNKHIKTKKNYSPQIKTFAFTIFYYSPRVYRYLRTVFTLPNPRTIRRWLQTIHCEPGFQIEVFKQISEKQGPKLYSLVLDGMSIRKQAIVQKGSDKIIGHVDYGGSIGSGDKSGVLATEALVLLLVPLLERTRYPVGFFFIDKIDSQLQASLVTQCLTLAHEHKIEVVNVTCDGAPSNIATLNKLGASIPEKPYFKHPAAENQVTTTLDPAHMLKLCRNAWATLRVFKSGESEIDYKYIENLINYQEKIGQKLANKLSKKHMQWKNMKMKVKLAAEVLSSSVADALEYLRVNDKEFEGCGPTIDFIRQVRL